MPRTDYKNCRGCGRHTSECGVLSRSRLCIDCGLERNAQAAVQMQTHSGPVFQHWRRRIAASVGAVIE